MYCQKMIQSIQLLLLLLLCSSSCCTIFQIITFTHANNDINNDINNNNIYTTTDSRNNKKNSRLVQETTTSLTSSSSFKTMNELIQKLENDTILFRNYVQSLLQIDYTSNSNITNNNNNETCLWTDNSCLGYNYEHCLSKFPNEVCLVYPYFGDNNLVSACTNTLSCSMKVDYSISSIRLSNDLRYSYDSINDKYSKIISTLCKTSTLLDTWLQTTYTNNIQYYQKYHNGYLPLGMHYGTMDGVHRIYPARSTFNSTNGMCKNDYDPRTRPWYSAAIAKTTSTTSTIVSSSMVSDSPIHRHIVLLIDVSVTMIENPNRINRVILSITRIIDTLTINDIVSIILFDTEVLNTNTSIYSVNSNNKNYLLSVINNITTIASERSTSTNGTTTSSNDQTVSNIINFTIAFDTALNNIIRTAYTTKDTTICSTALLLFTDGVKAKVTDLLVTINNYQIVFEQIENLYVTKLILFVYSMSLIDIEYNYFNCQSILLYNPGLWGQIVENDKIVSGLSNYYDLYQLFYERQHSKTTSTTSTNTNTNPNSNQQQGGGIVAWIEPYKFFSFNNMLGITLSAPVFGTTTVGNNNQQQRRIIGVVGIDFSLHAFQNGTSDYTYNRLIEQVTGTTTSTSTSTSTNSNQRQRQEQQQQQSQSQCPDFTEITQCDLRYYYVYNPSMVCSKQQQQQQQQQQDVVTNSTTNTTVSTTTIPTCIRNDNNIYLDDNKFVQNQCCSKLPSCNDLSILWNNTIYEGLANGFDRSCCLVVQSPATTITDSTTTNTSTMITNPFIHGTTEFGQCLISMPTIDNTNSTNTTDGDTETQTTGSKSGLSGGWIAGTVLMLLFFIIIIGFTTWYALFRQPKDEYNPNDDDTN